MLRQTIATVSALIIAGSVNLPRQASADAATAAIAAAQFVRSSLAAGDVVVLQDSGADAALVSQVSSALKGTVHSRAEMQRCASNASSCRQINAAAVLLSVAPRVTGDTAVVEVESFTRPPVSQKSKRLALNMEFRQVTLVRVAGVWSVRKSELLERG